MKDRKSVLAEKGGWLYSRLSGSEPLIGSSVAKPPKGDFTGERVGMQWIFPSSRPFYPALGGTQYPPPVAGQALPIHN